MPVAVSVAGVTERTIAQPLEASGNVVAAHSARVGAAVAGRLVEVRVNVGDRVAAGQTLAVVDDSSYRAQLAQAAAVAAGAGEGATAATAAIAQAQARATLADSTARRMGLLYAAGAISRQDLDRAVSDRRAATAAAEQARAQAAAAGDAVSAAGAAQSVAAIAAADSVIRAPFDGVVTERLEDTGAVVGPGSPVVAIEDDRRLEVDVAAPQGGAPIEPGQTVTVHVPDRGVSVRASVERTAPADPALRSTLVRIALPALAGVAPGTYVRVDLPSRATRARTVPLDAIVTRSGQTGVFVIDNGAATFVPVRTGAADLRFVEVQGLRETDRSVATGNLERLSDGTAVSVDGER